MNRIIIALAAAALSLPALAAAPLPADSLLTGRPYLQNTAPDAVTVMYTSPEGRQVQSWVEYTTDTTATPLRARQLYAGQEVVHSPVHRVRLEGLTPATPYYYRVRAREITVNKAYHKEFGEAEQVTPWHSFTLPAADADSWTAVIVNDTHNHRPTFSRLGALTDSIAPDLVIFNGDCLPEPPTLGAAIKAMNEMVDAFGLSELPSVVIRGNHEIRNAYSSGMPQIFDNPGGLTYGAFNLGDTRFVTLDLGEDKPDTTWVYYGLNDFDALRAEQADFLRLELASPEFRQAARRVLVHHIPVYGNTDRYRPCTTLWSPILADAPFDIDIAAHTHEYRFHPAGTVDANPFPVMVGGAPEPAEATLAILRKQGSSLTLEVIDINGRTIDTLSL